MEDIDCWAADAGNVMPDESTGDEMASEGKESARDEGVVREGTEALSAACRVGIECKYTAAPYP